MTATDSEVLNKVPLDNITLLSDVNLNSSINDVNSVHNTSNNSSFHVSCLLNKTNAGLPVEV